MFGIPDIKGAAASAAAEGATGPKLPAAIPLIIIGPAAVPAACAPAELLIGGPKDGGTIIGDIMVGGPVIGDIMVGGCGLLWRR